VGSVVNSRTAAPRPFPYMPAPENLGYVARQGVCRRGGKTCPTTEATMADARPQRRQDGEQTTGGTVTAAQLSKYLDFSCQRICALADVEHVIVRPPVGRFDQDDCRVRYLR
jgi:hypothetical protein